MTFFGGGVVNEVASFQSLVLGSQPCIQPERLDTHNLFLLVPHAAGDVHHVDDNGVGFWFVVDSECPVPAVFAGWNNHRVFRIVVPDDQMSAQRLLEGPLEMFE